MSDLIRREDAYKIAKKVVEAISDKQYSKCLLAYDIMDWIDDIPALERDRWISVDYANEASLPQKEKCVMVCAFGSTVGEGWYYGFDGFHHVWKLAVSSGTYWDDEVVAWMPLPEPPKEET